jgi:hypothetical protein
MRAVGQRVADAAYVLTFTDDDRVLIHRAVKLYAPSGAGVHSTRTRPETPRGLHKALVARDRYRAAPYFVPTWTVRPRASVHNCSRRRFFGLHSVWILNRNSCSLLLAALPEPLSTCLRCRNQLRAFCSPTRGNFVVTTALMLPVLVAPRSATTERITR